MPIKARYENGVFRPLEDVAAEEGTLADVYLPLKAAEGAERPALKDTPFYGMWADRTDFADGVEYVNRIRKYRREPQPEAEPERR